MRRWSKSWFRFEHSGSAWRLALSLTIGLSALPACGAKSAARDALPEEQPLNKPIPRLALTDSVDDEMDEPPSVDPRPEFPDSLSTPWYDLRGTQATPSDEQLDTGAQNYCEEAMPRSWFQGGHFEERESDNDTVCGARAQPFLGPGSEAIGELLSTDVDWFVFNAEGGSAHQLSVTCNMDTLLSVFSLEGELLGRDDNGGSGACSSLTLELSRGLYTVRVEPARAIAPGDYVLTVTQL